MLKRLIRVVKILALVYTVLLGVTYTIQERLLFFPDKLEAEYQFHFDGKFEEINLHTDDDHTLNGLHFYHPNPKGAVLFFHGNSASLKLWGGFAQDFAALGYDAYVFDYRGFGKSSGKIFSEEQFYADADLMTEYVLKDFKPEQIRVIGYSMGSGLAAHAAQKFSLNNLILVAPYFKLAQLAQEKTMVVPQFLVKYKIPTVNFMNAAPQAKITLIHGMQDRLIGIDNSEKLSQYLKPNDKFFMVKADHNSVLSVPEFWAILRERL